MNALRCSTHRAFVTAIILPFLFLCLTITSMRALEIHDVVASDLELQGTALGEITQHDAMMLDFHVPMLVDRLVKSGKAVPESVKDLLAAASAAYKKQDYYRSYRLYAKTAGIAEGKVEQYEVAASLKPSLNRAIFAGGEDITLTVRPLFTLGRPLANRYTMHSWLETESGVIAESDQTHTISELKEFKVNFAVEGLPGGVIAVGYRLISPNGQTIAEIRLAVVVANDIQNRLDSLKAKFAAAARNSRSNQPASMIAALSTIDYDIQSLTLERTAFSGNWQRAAHPFGAYLGRINFEAMGREVGNPFPQFNARLRFPQDIALAESLVDAIIADPETLLKHYGDMAQAFRATSDGKLLRYRIYVPAGYDSTKKYSLLVAIHSGGGDSTYFEWEDFFSSPGQHLENRLKQLAQEKGYIVVCPNGASGTFFSERDDPETMALVQRVREIYSIDPKRMFLTGWSVGASTAWRLAMQHPELFGAFAGVEGGADWLNRQNTEKARNLPILYSMSEAEAQHRKNTAALAKEFLPNFSYKEYPGTNHASVWSKALPDLFDYFDAQTPGSGSSASGSTADHQRPPLDVTYIGNEGFMIQSGGKTVLVDALFDTGFGRFLVPSQGLLAQMTRGSGPFADVDLLLVTHPHGDHFNPKLVIEFLHNHVRCQLVAHTQVVDLLRKEEGFAQIEGQIHEVKLAPGAYEYVSLNGITFDVLCLKHMADDPEKEPTRNLAFNVELGGAHFLHLGDARIDQSEAHLNRYPFEQTPIDILFLSRYDRSEATQKYVAEKIKPSKIVAMHIPPAELAEETNKTLPLYPHAIIFKQSMEQRSLPIEVDFHHLTGEYLGQTPPGATPQVFALGIVSTDANEHSAPSFSPDGNEVFWWANRSPDDGPPMSMTMRRENGRWSAPRVSQFGIMPAFSPDGLRVYFFAPQPRFDIAKDSQPTLDIWVAEKQGHSWSEPKCLNLVTRYPELREAAMPRVARNGTLYFIGYAPETKSNHGIYRAELINGEYTKPELLPRNINLPPFLNWAPFIAPDESYLLFSSNRTGSLDNYGDLYVSRRLTNGSWTDPVSLGEPINTPRQEVFPGLSPDGKYLFFCRHTPGHKNDVFWVDAASIPALHPVNTPSKEDPK